MEHSYGHPKSGESLDHVHNKPPFPSANPSACAVTPSAFFASFPRSSVTRTCESLVCFLCGDSAVEGCLDMYRIRLYIVPEEESSGGGGDVVENTPPPLVVGSVGCWWVGKAAPPKVPPKVPPRPPPRTPKRERKAFKGTVHGKEYDLEQKIDLEIKMREGTTKLLAACKHQTQMLEAAKNLLTSNERMSAYMAELQQRRKKDKTVDPTVDRGLGQPGSTARVSLSDIRMPLIWRDTDHFKNKGDYRRFAVFCLARIGTEIFDTALLSPVDRSLTDLTFPDVLVFNHVPADFEFKLEIYSHILQDDLTMASAPRKIKKTIHSSISRSVGKKLAASLKDELQTGKIGPNFELMATARLSLMEVHDSIHTHDLTLENVGNRSHQLPLFGHFCCRLAAQPDCISREVFSGPLQLLLTAEDQEREGLGGKGEERRKGKDVPGDRGSWFSVWGQLQAFHLDLWEKKDDFEKGRDAMRSIIVDRHTSIRGGDASSREVCLGNLCEGKEIFTFVRATSCDNQQDWIKHLVQHAKDHQRWKHAAEKIMEIQSPGSSRNSFLREIRQGSLYDETPLIENIQTEVRNGHRPTVQEIFGLTPSTSLSSCTSSSSSPPMPPFRERSLSIGTNGNATNIMKSGFLKGVDSSNVNPRAPSSTSSSSSCNSCPSSAAPLRSHWPFASRNNRK